MADAYLIDIMHAHFISLIDEVEELQKDKNNQKEKVDTLELELEISKNETRHWHGLYNAARAAADKIVNELQEDE